MSDSVIRLAPAVLGFGLVGGSMIFGLGDLLMRAPPALPWVEAGAEAGAETLPEAARGELYYVPLTRMLLVSLGRGKPTMEADLTVAVRGSTEELLALNSRIGTDIARIEAEMVQEAQVVVAGTRDAQEIHEQLPGRLKAAINRVIGTETWPEPVEEVLITALSFG